MGARGRLQGDPVHADDLAEGLLQPPHQLQSTLDGVFVLIRVQSRESLQPGGLFIGDRVVLHGAAAERVELLADGVVQRSHATVVAQDLGLAETGKRRWAAPAKLGRELSIRPHACLWKSGRGQRAPAQLEAQRFRHPPTSAVGVSTAVLLRTSTTVAMASGSFTSVQQKTTTPRSSGYHCPTGSPPRMPASRRFASDCSTWNIRTGNSFRKCRSGKASSIP